MSIIPSNNQQQTMTSREMADLTEKRHDSVKRTIETLATKGLVAQPQIVDGTKSANGVVESLYAVCKRDSYVIVAQLSPEFTARLVDRWQELENKITDPLAVLPADQRALIALMLDNAAIKETQAHQAEAIKRLESKQSAYDNGANFFTVIGYGVHKGISFSLTDASALGRSASRLSKENDIAVGSVRDPRFGKVNSYHESMLDAALSKIYGGM